MISNKHNALAGRLPEYKIAADVIIFPAGIFPMNG